MNSSQSSGKNENILHIAHWNILFSNTRKMLFVSIFPHRHTRIEMRENWIPNSSVFLLASVLAVLKSFKIFTTSIITRFPLDEWKIGGKTSNVGRDSVFLGGESWRFSSISNSHETEKVENKQKLSSSSNLIVQDEFSYFCF